MLRPSIQAHEDGRRGASLSYAPSSLTILIMRRPLLASNVVVVDATIGMSRLDSSNAVGGAPDRENDGMIPNVRIVDTPPIGGS